MNSLYCLKFIKSAGILAEQPWPNNKQLVRKNMPYRRFMCLLCGLIYDEEKGWPEDGIAPGTRWEDVPPAWACPECGASKDDFEMIEV